MAGIIGEEMNGVVALARALQELAASLPLDVAPEVRAAVLGAAAVHLLREGCVLTAAGVELSRPKRDPAIAFDADGKMVGLEPGPA